MEKHVEHTSENTTFLTVTPSAFARRSLMYAIELGYVEAKPRFSYKSLGQNAYLLLYSITNNGVLEYKGQTYSLHADQMVILDCSSPVTISNYYVTDIPPIKNHGERWHYLYIFFNGFQTKDYYDIITKECPFIISSENGVMTKSSLWQILEHHKNKHKYAEMVASSQVTKLLTETLLLNSSMAIESEYPMFINKIFHHLNHHSHEKITLDLLAEMFAMSKFHIAKEFKRCAGTTINEYVIQVRLNKAKTLLRHTEDSIAEIGSAIGMSNTSLFIKIFREREHITPLAYRKQWK